MTLFDQHAGVEPDPVADVALARVKLLVAYDGSAFHGFAANEGVTTVGGTLADAIGRVARHEPALTAAGRTDKGVHAWGQVVSCDLPTAVDLDELRHAVNQLCGGRIVVRAASWADEDFDARFSARARVYRYTIRNEPVDDPLRAGTTWWVDRPLDLRALQLAADPLIGEHDFASFCRRPRPRDGAEASLVRRVLDARWRDVSDERGRRLRFDVVASSFCHQMVRSVVGTMVEMGAGRKRAGEMAAILRAGDRSFAGQPAPPHGLCLWEVRY